MADKLRLTKLLTRYKKQELLEDVTSLLSLDIPEKQLQALGKKTKKEVTSFFVDVCLETNVSDVDILDLELQYATFHPSSFTWRAYGLEPTDSAHSTTESDPNAFCKRLQHYLNGSCNYHFTHDLKPNGHWLALRVQDNVPYTCYILRRPPAPFLLLAGLKKTHLELVLETLALALDCHGYRDLNLNGKNVDSLMDSLMYQHCQGAYSEYRLNQVDPNPLLAAAAARSRKRQKLTTEVSREEKADMEDPVKRRRHAADEAFGTNPLPKLEKFSIQLQSMALPDSDETITCKIKLSGSSVLEGIKESVACGSVTLPVPIILKSLPRCSTNRVTVKAESEPLPSLLDNKENWELDLNIDENG